MPRSLMPMTLGLVSALLAPSCQSLSEGLLSVEARAMILDDKEADEVGGSNFSTSDIDASAYGVQAAVMTPVLDIVGSLDHREFGDEEAPELAVGVRRRFLEVGPVHPYVEANLRFGTDLDTGPDEENYFGWNAGVGALVDLTDNLFLNFRLMYETLDVDVGADDTTIDGIVGTVGLGLHF